MQRVGVMDLESDGLYQECTKIHCMVVKTLFDNRINKYVGKDEIQKGIKFLLTLDKIVMHNGIDYDMRVIEKLYGVKLDVNKIIEPDGSSKGKPSTELGVIKKTDRIDSLTVREFPPLIKNLLNHVKQLGLGFCCRSRARICRSDMFQLQQTNFPVRFQLCQN